MSLPLDIENNFKAAVYRWRSMLFVPGNNLNLLAKAHSRGADAIIIDLEDSVAERDKPLARSALPAAVAALYKHSADVVVRINASWRDAIADLEAAVLPGLSAIMVPKVAAPERISVLAEILAEFENERQLAVSHIGLIALIESPAALTSLPAIAALKPLIGLALGTEDFALELGVPPSNASLDLPMRQIALAAASRKLMAFAAPISIAAYNDVPAYRAALQASRDVGVTGAICIHPSQVAVANECFSIDEKEFTEAETIVAAWRIAEREGRSVTSIDGRMIDRPVVQRALRIISQRGRASIAVKKPIQVDLSLTFYRIFLRNAALQCSAKAAYERHIECGRVIRCSADTPSWPPAPRPRNSAADNPGGCPREVLALHHRSNPREPKS